MAMLPVFADLIDYGVDSMSCSGIGSVSCTAFNLVIPFLVLGSLAIIVFYLYNVGGFEVNYNE
jgi:hypothetical protein